MAEITVPAQAERLSAVLDFVGGAMQDAGIDKQQQSSAADTVEEIFLNITNCAYPCGEGNITVSVLFHADDFSIEFKDNRAPHLLKETIQHYRKTEPL